MLSDRIIQATYLPFEIRKIFQNAEEATCERQDLWRGVIARAIFDALGFTGQSEKEKHEGDVESAREWFENGGNDLEEVFILANLPLYEIRESVLTHKSLTVEERRPKQNQKSEKRKADDKKTKASNDKTDKRQRSKAGKAVSSGVSGVSGRGTGVDPKASTGNRRTTLNVKATADKPVRKYDRRKKRKSSRSF